MSTTLPPATSLRQNGTSVTHKTRIWSETAPKHLTAAGASDLPGAGWIAWLEHVAERSTPLPFGQLFPGKASPLAWGLSGSAMSKDAVALHSRLKKQLKRRSAGQVDELAQAWLADSSGASATAALAFDSLAWAYALPALASCLSPQVWWRLVEQLTRTACDAAVLDNAGDILVRQLLAGELPLVLAAALPEIAACRALEAAAIATLRGGSQHLVSDKGLPRGDHLPLLPALLACWTRSLTVATTMQAGDRQAMVERLIASLRAALALMRRDGTPLLGTGVFDRRTQELFAAALRVAGDRATREMARRLAVVDAKPRKKKKHAKSQLPLPGVQCDTARLAVLRTDWTPAATSLAVRHDRAEIELELHRSGVTLANGVWSLEVLVDGQRACVERPWENVCWVSDEDVDYLELETKLAGGLRIQRQIMLARQENFLYMADAIVSPTARQLDYCGRLPLTDAVSCHPVEETREVQVHVGKQIGMALPLALPEWRRNPRGGNLSAEGSGLQLRQSRSGTGLYAPLWIDLDRKRSRKPLTWRQLTIAQNRQGVPADTAVGYRVQIGGRQWLIYRSLGPRANRTLLGSNLISEFMLARFSRAGEAEPLLEIE